MLKLTIRRLWKSVREAAPDPIHNSLYLNDPVQRKANLSVGIFRNDFGRPWAFPSVTKAQSSLEPSFDPVPVLGSEDFLSQATDLIFGQAVEDFVSIQTMGGMGGLFLCIDFLKDYYPHFGKIYIPNSAWAGYYSILLDSGLPFSKYRYLDINSMSINESDLLSDISEAPRNSVFIFQVAGHNPTGTDLSKDQWNKIQDIFAMKQHLMIFSNNYHGVCEDLETDIYPVRLFTEKENPFIHAYSFSANMGLYGSRLGVLHFRCDSALEVKRIQSRFEHKIKGTYSYPVAEAARIATCVLKDHREEWINDLKFVSDSLKHRRTLLTESLVLQGSRHKWGFLEKQIGFYAYTGLTPGQVEQIYKRHHVYMLLDGRLAISAVNPNNVASVAEAIDTVTRYE